MTLQCCHPPIINELKIVNLFMNLLRHFVCIVTADNCWFLEICFRYNPYVQARGRIDQLKRLGHSVDKVRFF